ncbi:MAG TPA: hypothetical protein VFG83_11555, partial [Kofleriaceae bacterium]|nr:hypothetical protein [Kofleriaceae bacterium]
MTSRLSVSILGAAMMLSGACATVVPVTPQGVALAPNQRQPPDPSGCHANPGGEACRGDGNTMLAY